MPSGPKGAQGFRPGGSPWQGGGMPQQSNPMSGFFGKMYGPAGHQIGPMMKSMFGGGGGYWSSKGNIDPNMGTGNTIDPNQLSHTMSTVDPISPTGGVDPNQLSHTMSTVDPASPAQPAQSPNYMGGMSPNPVLNSVFNGAGGNGIGVPNNNTSTASQNVPTQFNKTVGGGTQSPSPGSWF